MRSNSMPAEGLIHTGSHTTPSSTVLGGWLRCAPVPGLRDRGHACRTVLRLQLADPLSGTKFDDVVVPFRKFCGLPDSWLHNGFGSEDDYGHLGAFTMLVGYSLCLLLTALPNSSSHFKEPGCGRLGKLLAQMLSPFDFGAPGGCLEATVLLLGGGSFMGLSSMVYVHKQQTNLTTHELYHFTAHFYMFCMGFVCLATRLLPAFANATFPVFVMTSGVFFAFHSQPNPFSEGIHQMTAILQVLFALCRVSGRRFALAASFLGLWAGVNLQLSCRRGVNTAIEFSFDVPSVTFACGSLSAMIWASVVFLVQGRADAKVTCLVPFGCLGRHTRLAEEDAVDTEVAALFGKPTTV
ncbi:unnamed protein product [Polarella glacialis]|uniref:Uncharacterized protein n=1 Tax=Polarella glacialis TaxID=89957 RepID=A0A813HK41_POLGL|nr:unnamed protein product [Polarella glacialis]CAE8638103.1 unnamed protein product [Polarella glacialis]